MSTGSPGIGLYIVTSRKGRVSRNNLLKYSPVMRRVTSRKGRVSRNVSFAEEVKEHMVTSRKGRVSRNFRGIASLTGAINVTSRKGRVSRNLKTFIYFHKYIVTSRKWRRVEMRKRKWIRRPRISHVPQGACE